jgi:hypothetical protein
VVRSGPVSVIFQLINLTTKRGTYSRVQSVATALPSISFINWHREHYVVVHSDPCITDDDASESIKLREVPSRRQVDCGKGVDLGSEDAAWLEQKDVSIFLMVSVSLLSLACVYHASTPQHDQCQY